MSEYCLGCKKATITINSPFLTIEVDAPAEVQIVDSSLETYIHDMTTPINQTYDRVVKSVALTTSGQTYNNGAPVNPIRDCPIPSINGKQITSDFDNYYPDNTGSCSYQVILGGGISINGKTYASNDNQFQVACDSDCPNGYCKIDCEQYPGYCCISDAEIKSLINQLNS